MTAPDPGEREAPVTLSDRPLPGGVERTLHLLADGHPVACDRTWEDAFAVVEHGSIELRALHGGRLVLREGGCFSVALTGAVSLRAVGGGPAVVATVRRRPAARRTPTPPERREAPQHGPPDHPAAGDR